MTTAQITNGSSADDRTEVAQERQPRVGGGQVEPVRMLQHFQREHHRDDHLPGHLRPAAQSYARLPKDLQKIVDEPDQSEAGHHQENQHA